MSDKPYRIVVGIDGSEASIGAARWAAPLAEKLDASLHLVHSMATSGHFIADAAVIAIRAAATADQHAAAEKVLTLATQAVHEDTPTVEVTTEIAEDAADKALVRLSRTAKLVVIGCEDVHPAAALLLGSTSLSVATHAHAPVAVWRRVPPASGQSVVVGVDGAPAGAAALATAFELADILDAPVTAIHSWSIRQADDEMIQPYFIDWALVEAEEKTILDEALEPWTTRYPNIEVRRIVGSIKASRALLQQLDGAQLVVVGNRRHNALSAALLGSTSLNLLHHSPVPVVVCHASDPVSRESTTTA